LALKEILEYLNVEIKLRVSLGKDIELEDLTKIYDKVILAFGANVSSKMNVLGENLPDVLGANELLENKKFPDFSSKTVCIIGGGNVAMDAARTIKRLGAKETIVIYRRAKQQMPAEPKEVMEAEEDGIKFMFQTNLKEIKENRLHLIKTELVNKENSSRPVPVEIMGSDFEINADYVIMAIGSKINSSLLRNIETNEKGYVNVNENYETSLPNVYAIGDCIGGKATVASAALAGRNVAQKICGQ